MTSTRTKETALQQLASLIEAADQLRRSSSFSPEHTRWVASTLRFLEEVFGQASRYYLTFNELRWSGSGSLITRTSDPEGTTKRWRHEGYLKDLGTAKGLLQAALDELSERDLNHVYHGADTPAESSELIRILNLVERKLRKVLRGSPTTEREIQEAVENLLIGADIAYSREAATIEYSSKKYIPDFSFPKIETVLETKLCGREGREKEIISEINDDILAYKTMFRNIVFVVYDVGLIRDIDRFGGHFETHDGVVVRVVKH